METLSTLTLPQLQGLALRYNVKPNQNTESIMKSMLQVTSEDEVPCNDQDSFNTSAGISVLTTDNLAAHNQSVAGITSGDLEVPRRPRPPPKLASECSFGSAVSSDIGPNNDLLASQEQLKATVQMMACMDAEDRAILQKIRKLQTTAEEIRSRSAFIRQRVIGQRDRRERVEKYLVYYQDEPMHWTFEQIWDYPFRTWDVDIPFKYQFEVTSSNGDGPTDEVCEAIRQDKTRPFKYYTLELGPARPPENVTHYDFLDNATTTGNTAGSLEMPQYPDVEELQHEENSTSLTENLRPAELSEGHITRASQALKRRRDEELDEDDIPSDSERYQPRLRRDVAEQPSPSPQASNSSADRKGKGKMSAEEVQRMQEEAGRERSILQEEVRNGNDRELIINALGLSAKDIEEDEAVSRHAESRRSSEVADKRNIIAGLSAEEIEEDIAMNRIQPLATGETLRYSSCIPEESLQGTRRPARRSTRSSRKASKQASTIS